MSLDMELDELRRDWQSESPRHSELRTVVEKQSRGMRLMLLADIAVTVFIGGGVSAWAAFDPQPGSAMLTWVTWGFIAVAWAAAFVLNRGKWAPAALDTASYLDLSVRRCRARLAATWFGAGLYIAETAFCLSWVYLYGTDRHTTFLRWLAFRSVAVDLVWVFTLVFAVGLFRYRRKKLAELRNLLEWSYDSVSIFRSK